MTENSQTQVEEDDTYEGEFDYGDGGLLSILYQELLTLLDKVPLDKPETVE